MNEDNIQIEIMVRAVKMAMQNKNEIILVTALDGSNAFMLQGDPKKLSFLLWSAMKVDERFATVMEIALKVFRKERPEVNDILKFLKELMDFEPLDCDNCPVDLECEVRDEMHCAKEMPEELRELITNIFNNKKGGQK